MVLRKIFLLWPLRVAICHQNNFYHRPSGGVDLAGLKVLLVLWSSVNNCTGSESDPPILDLTKPLSRRERRELTNRLRKQKPAVRRKFTHGTDEQTAVIVKTIDEIHLTTGITISRGEALHLMAGGKSCFDGKWLRVTAKGEIFSAAPSHQARARKILNRVAALAELATKM